MTIFHNQEIKVSFGINEYQLMKGCQGVLGKPVEAFLNLYAVKGGKITKRISSPEDLSSIVSKIKNEREALEFVRLFTSPDRHYLFEKERGTIELSKIKDGEKRSVGTIFESRYNDLGLKEPSVVKKGNRFIMERNLVKFSFLSKPRELVRIAQSVSTTGTYRLLNKEIITEVEPHDVLIPYYE